MRKYGPNQMSWETSNDDNKVLSRLDLAITQMIEAGVIRCVDVAKDTRCRVHLDLPGPAVLYPPRCQSNCAARVECSGTRQCHG